MKQQGLLFFTDTYLLYIGFFLFFIPFVMITFQVFRAKNKNFYKSMANLPINEGKNT